jgi:hypothetical protein
MNERQVPIGSITIDDLPEDIAELIRRGDVNARLHLTGTGVIECYVRDFAVRDPNATTIAAMEEAERGEFVGEYKTVDELFQALNADD